MVHVSDLAAAAIRCVVEPNRAPNGTGLRISRGTPERPLRVGLAGTPEPGDTVVVVAAGERVFLDAAAVSLLDGQTLDVSIGVRGRVEFFTGRPPIEPGR